MSWKAKPLREVLSNIKTGSTPSTSHPEYFGGSIPWFTPSDIGAKKELVKSSRYLSEEGTKRGRASLFPKGSLLVTCIGNIGRVGVLQQPGSSNQQITSLLFNNEVNVDYAYYWFLANQKELEHQANQAVVPILNNQRLEEIEFTYPSAEDEQKRIATVLGMVDRLRCMRRYARQLSDAFLQSVFVEMFTANLNKERGKLLRDVLAIPLSNGSFETNDMYGSGSPVIWVDNLYHTMSIDLLTLRRAKLSEEALKKYAVAEDDLLFTRSSLVREGIGQVNIVPKLREETAFECHVIRARVNRSQVNPFYILGLYRSSYGKRLIMERANTATMTTISQTAIEALPCPIPPSTLQDKFAQTVLRFEQLRAQQREAERQAEHLFQTLLHRAFTGELIGVPNSKLVKRKPSISAQKRTYTPGVFYRRAAIEAYVINALRGDKHLGRTKLEKIDHLIEFHCGIDLERYPTRDAAGPDDYPSRMKLEHLADKRNWFRAYDKKDGSIVKYLPKRGFKSAVSKGVRAIGENRLAVDNLLTLMRPLDTKRCEIIATLYAAWNDFLLAGKIPSDAEIVHDVLNNWRPEKQLIPERRWLRGLKWMRENGLVPRGQGKRVLNPERRLASDLKRVSPRRPR